MNTVAPWLCCLVAVLGTSLPDRLFAQPAGAAEIGVRVLALRADVDIEGAGIAARLPLRHDWFVDLTLERQAWSRGGAESDPGRLDVTTLAAGAALGRRYRGDGGRAWFWSWGLAAGMPDPAPGTDGVVSATEVHLRASLGLTQPLAPHWLLTAALRMERHYVDTRRVADDGRLLERISVRSPVGVYVALSYRF